MLISITGCKHKRTVVGYGTDTLQLNVWLDDSKYSEFEFRMDLCLHMLHLDK